MMGGAAPVKRKLANRRLARLSDTLSNLADPRCGIIRYIAEEPRRPEFPNIVQYAAETCDTAAFLDHSAFGKAGGCSTSRPIALAKAVGEAVERYSAAIYDEQDCPLFSYAEAPGPCIPPAEWTLNNADQYRIEDFEWVPFTDRTPIRWTPAKDLRSGEQLYVPAAKVYVPFYFYPGSGEPPICQPISTGLACHCSWEEAVVGGLSEVVERDAFMITWQARMSRPHLDPSTLPADNKRLFQLLESVGAKVKLFDITMDNQIPCVMAVQTHDSPHMPAISFACSAALEAEEAVRKAMEELTHTSRWMFYIKHREGPLDPGTDFANVDGQERHLQYWASHENRHLADWVYDNDTTVSFGSMTSLETGSPEGDLEVIIDRIEATGHKALAVDITAPDIADAGLTVVRAIVPGYHPLIMGYPIRAMGGSRLWTVPQALGYPGVSPETGDNPIPHPFP